LARYVLVLVLSILVGCSEEELVTNHLFDSFSVHGMGQTTCIEYNENSNIDNFNIAMRVYLQGYFTAINTTGSALAFEIDEDGLTKSIKFIKTQCATPDNHEMFVAQLLNIFWRVQLKEFQSSANK